MLPPGSLHGMIRKNSPSGIVHSCGRYRTSEEEQLRMAKPFAVTDATFESEVLESSLPVLVDFWADWCGPCKMIAPIVDELANEYEGKIRVAKLDADANLNTMQAYGVMGIPTLILFKDGEAVERITGYMPKDRLLTRLSPHFG
jgi:thioredoxin 1